MRLDVFLRARKKITVDLRQKNCFICGFGGSVPDRKFNKFHGMFCTICRRYVYMYQMAGRISEEINEAFNATLIDINITTTTHIEGTNVRAQINLKGEILEHTVELQCCRRE